MGGDKLMNGICWVGSHEESFNEPGYGSRPTIGMGWIQDYL